MRRIRVGVVGAGYLGRFHVQKYAELSEAELVGVVDIDRDRAEKAARGTGAFVSTDYKDLYGKVDAVSIVTPTETHHRIGMDFLSRGVDVLIEKPITVTCHEAEELVKEAEKNSAILQVGHLERFNPAVLALDGRLNNPMFIESHRLSPFPYRSIDVDVVLDLMIHDIDIILNLVDSDVESVDAVGIPVISKKVDIANARLKFRNGCVANVTASRVSKETVRKIRLFQADAYISIDYAAQQIAIFKRVADKSGALPSIVEEDIEIARRDSLMDEIKSFLECSASRRPPLVSGSDGKRALEVARKIQDSARSSVAAMLGRPGSDLL